jgi:transposase
MDQPFTVGLDLAKSVFQLHGVDAEGRVVVRRQLRRRQVLAFFERLEPCLVGIEGCSGAHHRARKLIGPGHEVRLMPPAYVKPHVKCGKTDAADAEAICEAVTPTMRFVLVKSTERQGALLDHKMRDFLIRPRTRTMNAIRPHVAAFGIVVAKGIHNVARPLDAAQDMADTARPALDLLADQLRDLEERIEAVTARMTATQKEDALARRLATVPGLGPIASSAFAATTPDMSACRSARDDAAWLGLTPRTHSSGGKERLGRISRAGSRYLRRLLCLGAMARISRDGGRGPPCSPIPGLARSDAGAQAHEGRGDCARRTHGTDGLGAHRPARKRPGRARLRTRLLPGAPGGPDR